MYENISRLARSLWNLYSDSYIIPCLEPLKNSMTTMESRIIVERFKPFDKKMIIGNFYLGFDNPHDKNIKKPLIKIYHEITSHLKICFYFDINRNVEIFIFSNGKSTRIFIEKIDIYEYSPDDFVEHRLSERNPSPQVIASLDKICNG